ncbi:HsdR family type I site-specific deoxyribonuclease [Polaromonas sp. SM01]|uniref:type I restriction endonuclease subunit R n=1 Tax=Polaromonas sp. SM01 TaxID=3085630 RepID=UPI0029813B35|nr:HsdR family type I site-specific deoxyribonuclease [Polaromonas sp. SM01]MDW5441325.1 HsdR family type I site-specific deoxyribonuclease [Polaromonas sp. SM01]
MTTAPAPSPPPDPDFDPSEVMASQAPALQLLLAMGWQYLSPAKARQLRGSRLLNVVLDDVLRDALKRFNRIHTTTGEHLFSEENLSTAIQRLKSVPYNGLLRTNEAVYDLLTLGTTLEQTIDGDSRGRSLRYIDWQHPLDNTFQVSPELVVQRSRSQNTIRCDLVLFVNGIPLAVIECKAPGVEVAQGVAQLITYQGESQAPHLFVMAQMLLAINGHSARVGTVGSPAKFWSTWREDAEDASIARMLAQPLPRDVQADLFELVQRLSGGRPQPGVAEDTASYLVARSVTEQDRTLAAVLSPQRLLALVFHYTVFDGGIRKVARYQQVRAIDRIMERITHWEVTPTGAQRRSGGVVWHTQGSGKSLTMVMLARRLALQQGLVNPRIVLVTDRDDLDKQIEGTFKTCGLEPKRAATARELLALVQSPKSQIITTLIQKFDRVSTLAKSFAVDLPDVFVLVDEGHRTNFGSLAAKMRLLMPNACYIGFTGTPVTRRERNTLTKFGGLIDSYTMDEAVRDGAVVKLLYESRMVDVTQDQHAIDKWFERQTAGLSEAQKGDLKRKYAREKMIQQANPTLYMLAFDISEHYRTTWQGTPFKGQVVAASRAAAIQLKEYIDEIGHVSCEVLISGPAGRPDREDVDDEPTEAVYRFWDKMMKRHGNEEQYNKALINAFKHGDTPELLIVKDKLLTGFDAPRNRVLYLTRPLKEHTLLQAIARVNRLYEAPIEAADDEDGTEPVGATIEKDFGQIIDYAGVLEELDKAISSYQALAGFDENDLAGMLVSMQTEVAQLPEAHAHLLELFRQVANQHDTNAYLETLRDDDVRHDFYERLSAFGRLLQLALSSERFLACTALAVIDRYKADMLRFAKLKQAAQLRFADAVDFKRDYEPRIRKLLDTHLQANDVLVLKTAVNILDDAALKRAIDEQEAITPAAQADIIAFNTKRVIEERIKVDPAYYEKFSRMIQQAIDDYRAKRINELAYLQKAKEARSAVLDRPRDDIPTSLRGNDHGIALFGLAKKIFDDVVPPEQSVMLAQDTAQAALAVLAEHNVVDFWRNLEAMNQTRIELDHFLYDVVGGERGVKLSTAHMDAVIDQALALAKNRGING